MSINGQTVGKDYSFGYYDADSQTMVDLGSVQNLKINALKHDIKNQPYNDVPSFGYIPDGYKISGTIVRTSSALEDFQLAANTRFNSGQSSAAGYLNEIVNNADGSQSKYQYTGFVFWLTDIGDVTREQNVKMTFEGMASDKKPL